MKKAAFFDIDGTLVKCQTQAILTKVMRNEHLITLPAAAQIFLWFTIYKLGLVKTSIDIRRRFYIIFASRPKEEIDRIFDRTCTEILHSQLRWKVKELIDEHRSKGDLVFGISGSLSNLCLPICQKFNVEKVFSTHLILSEGRYNGSWEGEILEGNAKAELIKRLAATMQFDLSESTAYADSFADLPMLQAVGNPIAVYPDRRLKKYALRNGWKIIEDSVV